LFRVKSFALLFLFLVVATALAVSSRPPQVGTESLPVISLDGKWNFVTDPSASLKIQDLASTKDSREIQVPGSWQEAFPDLRDYAGVAWYWRSVMLDQLQPRQVALLKFGAVDYRAVVT